MITADALRDEAPEAAGREKLTLAKSRARRQVVVWPYAGGGEIENDMRASLYYYSGWRWMIFRRRWTSFESFCRESLKLRAQVRVRYSYRKEACRRIYRDSVY